MATKANKEGLYEALRGNNVDTALAILDAKKTMSPNMREPVENGVPLLQAAVRGQLSTGEKFNGQMLLEGLILRGADVNLRLPSGKTVMHDPALTARAARTLIEAGADLESKVSKTDLDAGQVKGETPLLSSIKAKNPDVAKVLIEAGANVNARDQDRVTPLHAAAFAKDGRTANLLIEAGADINARTADKDNPLSAVEALKQNGIPLMAKVPAASQARENSVESGQDRGAEVDPEVAAIVAQQRENLRKAARNPKIDTEADKTAPASPSLDGQARDFAKQRRADLDAQRAGQPEPVLASADNEAREFAARQRQRVRMERESLGLNQRVPESGPVGSPESRAEEKSGPSVRLDQKTADTRSDAVPSHVKERFLQVDNKFYFPDKTHAFDDKGQKLSTKSENQQVIASLVDIAKARGWEKVTVRGTEDFRRAAWLEASMNGLEVSGYKPTAIEKAHLAKLVKEPVKENSIEASTERVKTTGQREAVSPAGDRQAQQPAQPANDAPKAERPADLNRAKDFSLREGVVTGKLIEHGEAKYQFDEKKDKSYFVRVQTDAGERTIWGKDLGRAMRDSKVKEGETVALEKVASKDVVAKEKVFDEKGNVTGTREVDAIRNTWKVGSVDKAQAFVYGERSEVVNKHPELAPAYGTVAAAHKFAEKQWPNSKEEQERFVAVAQIAMAERIAHGDPVPSPKIREAQLVKEKSKDQPEPSKTPEKEAAR
ncbi:LPD7 domain-containing protein [Pseudomonas helleri]|uniref:LPD7 domain-containing protein n=1 Tax=Pseudomonas helleri TaxID=1608996 RepID=UPI003FD4B500